MGNEMLHCAQHDSRLDSLTTARILLNYRVEYKHVRSLPGRYVIFAASVPATEPDYTKKELEDERSRTRHYC